MRLCENKKVVPSNAAAVFYAIAASASGRSGGIGRRAWFRSMYPQGCGGSSPFFGTKQLGFFAGGLRRCTVVPTGLTLTSQAVQVRDSLTFVSVRYGSKVLFVSVYIQFSAV